MLDNVTHHYHLPSSHNKIILKFPKFPNIPLNSQYSHKIPNIPGGNLALSKFPGILYIVVTPSNMYQNAVQQFPRLSSPLFHVGNRKRINNTPMTNKKSITLSCGRFRVKKENVFFLRKLDMFIQFKIK